MEFPVKHLVIVGAGFSGTVTAIEFLKSAPKGARLTIINRSGKMARGLAYGTNSPDHLLNVPAGNMSALVDEPHSFIEYVRQFDPVAHSGSFVSRKLYGAYLSDLLRLTKEQSCVQCESITGEVCSVVPQANGEKALIRLHTGEQLVADHVVLAFGNFPPATPKGLQPLVNSQHYVEDPWALNTLNIRGDAPRVLLIGCGLTAVDILISLLRLFPKAEITMLSRRGLLPTDHREKLPAPGFVTRIGADLLAGPATVTAYVRRFRHEIARYPDHWREIVAALRPIAPQLWSRLNISERQRFLRHVQPHWDIYRHRVAPQTFRIYQDALAASRAKAIAGRVVSARVTGEHVSMTIIPKGGGRSIDCSFDRVINCTGPCTDIRKISDPLISFLSKESMIHADALGIGIAVAQDYSVMGGFSGSLSHLQWLSYVGPMLKAQLWEATAVPELREHSRALAIKIVKLFGG
jgi:uncharacterized NAD(P)/FAD-binding protein YdhS